MPIRIQTLIKPIRILSFVWGPYFHKQQNHGSKEKTVALETADNSVTTPRRQTFRQFGGKMCSGEQEPWHDLSLPNLHDSWLVSPLPEIPVCNSQYFPQLCILLISYLFSHTQAPRFLGHCGQGSCVVCVCIPHSHWRHKNKSNAQRLSLQSCVACFVRSVWFFSQLLPLKWEMKRRGCYFPTASPPNTHHALPSVVRPRGEKCKKHKQVVKRTAMRRGPHVASLTWSSCASTTVPRKMCPDNGLSVLK